MILPLRTSSSPALFLHGMCCFSKDRLAGFSAHEETGQQIVKGGIGPCLTPLLGPLISHQSLPFLDLSATNQNDEETVFPMPHRKYEMAGHRRYVLRNNDARADSQGWPTNTISVVPVSP